MFEADMTSFKFTFSETACIKSIIYFGIMYLLVMIFNTFSVSKCKLIDLLHSSKKNEKVKMKNPIICIFVFIIAVIMLVYSYSLVAGGMDKFPEVSELLKPITLGALSTFLIFWSFSGLMLKIVMSTKGVYYHNLNSFILRQVSSKINTMVISMSIICLMLFITLGVLSTAIFLSTAISMKDSLNENLKKYSPVDFEITKKVNLDDEELMEYLSLDKINDYEKDLYNKEIKELYRNEKIDLDLYTKDIGKFYVYKVNNLNLKYTLDSKFEEISEKYKKLSYLKLEKIMNISEYNKVAELFGTEKFNLNKNEYIIVATEKFNLNKNEYIIVANRESSMQVRNEALAVNTEIEINGVKLKPKYNKCQNGTIELASQKVNDGVIIVPDNLLKDEQKYTEYIFGNYKADTKEEKANIEKIIFNLDTNEMKKMYSVVFFNTKLDIAEASVGLGAIVTFVGLYLGIIFLVSSSAILALKELSESSDNKERFVVLRKIGTDEKMLNQALFRQIGIFFLFPLLLAIIHSIFGMKFISTLLSVLGMNLVNKSTIVTYLFLIIIYGLYFIITYLCSKNIIKER